MPRARSPIALRLLVAAVVLTAGALSTPHATWAGEPGLRELVQEYESHLVRRDEIAYAAQRRALGRIAALRTKEARNTLQVLLARYGRADRRRAAVLLGAQVRYGNKAELDRAIDWVEARKDPLLVDLLHRIVAEARLPGTRAHLREGALKSATPRVKAQIVRALGSSGEQAALGALLQVVREPHRLVRVEALDALGRLGSARALPILQVFLRDGDVNVRDAAARGLGHLGNAQAVPALVRSLEDASGRVTESAAAALAKIDDPRAIPPLIEGLARVHGTDLRVADAFTAALQTLSGKHLHDDPQLWRAWWATVKDKVPFQKAKEKPGTRTVPGPRYYGFPVRSSKIVFVLDVSRSMGWNKRLELAQKELIQVLERLPRTTRFKLLVFSDDVQAWPKHTPGALAEARPSTIAAAIAFVRKLKPQNGTHTYEALAKAFEHPDADTIFILSDGNPSGGRLTDAELILMRVRDWNRFRRVRIHSFFMLRGQPPIAMRSLEDPERAFDFMKRLAKENDGRFRKVD